MFPLELLLLLSLLLLLPLLLFAFEDELLLLLVLVKVVGDVDVEEEEPEKADFAFSAALFRTILCEIVTRREGKDEKLSKSEKDGCWCARTRNVIESNVRSRSKGGESQEEEKGLKLCVRDELTSRDG